MRGIQVIFVAVALVVATLSGGCGGQEGDGPTWVEGRSSAVEGQQLLEVVVSDPAKTGKKDPSNTQEKESFQEFSSSEPCSDVGNRGQCVACCAHTFLSGGAQQHDAFNQCHDACVGAAN
jgi:hypothetical protein